MWWEVFCPVESVEAEKCVFGKVGNENSVQAEKGAIKCSKAGHTKARFSIFRLCVQNMCLAHDLVPQIVVGASKFSLNIP